MPSSAISNTAHVSSTMMTDLQFKKVHSFAFTVLDQITLQDPFISADWTGIKFP